MRDVMRDENTTLHINATIISATFVGVTEKNKLLQRI